jgi:exosortase
VVAYLAYLYLREDISRKEESSPWGFAFLLPGLLMVVVDSAIRTQLLSAIGLVFSLLGLTLLLLGARRSKALGFPLVLLFFMLPIPTAFIDRLVLVLRRISATGCEHVASLTGLPVLRDFTTLYLPNSSLEIADACSGFSTLYASVTMALILAYLTPSTARRVAILISAVPVAIGCNILRCTLLAYLVNYQGAGVLETPLHPLTGIFSFSFALAILFLISWFRAPKERSSDTSLSTIPPADNVCSSADVDTGRSSLLR